MPDLLAIKLNDGLLPILKKLDLKRIFKINVKIAAINFFQNVYWNKKYFL